MFQSWGPEDLYPVVRTRDYRSFSALHSSIPLGWRVLHMQGATAGPSDLERANAGREQFKGRPDDRHLEPVSKTDYGPAHSNFYRSLSLATSAFGNSVSCLEPYHFFDAFQNIVRILKKAFHEGRPGSNHSHMVGPKPLSEKAFMGFCLICFTWRISLGVGSCFVYWAGGIRSRFWLPSLSRRCSMSIA